MSKLLDEDTEQLLREVLMALLVWLSRENDRARRETLERETHDFLGRKGYWVSGRRRNR